jgi:dolichyl-phosphate beta-glucosyltransferase
MEHSRPELSVIIPAYNEEHRLPKSLDAITTWMQTVPFAVEVLIVENGSQDHTTEIAESYACRFSNIRVIHSSKGKGAAVRKGAMHSEGSYLFICDADLSMPIGEVEKFLPPYMMGYDVIIASREAPGARRYNEPRYRHLMGRVFNFIVRLLVVPGFQDTQCGFKVFKKEAAIELFPLQTIEDWTFDVEILYLALQRGYRVEEVPINWYYNPDSRVRPLQDTWHMLWNIFRIRWNALQGIYNRPPAPGLVAKRSTPNG